MTIYTEWGIPVEILASWQEEHPGTAWKCVIRELDTGEKYVHDVLRLKADDAWNEIDPAIKLADIGVSTIDKNHKNLIEALYQIRAVVQGVIFSQPLIELGYDEAVRVKDFLRQGVKIIDEALK